MSCISVALRESWGSYAGPSGVFDMDCLAVESSVSRPSHTAIAVFVQHTSIMYPLVNNFGILRHFHFFFVHHYPFLHTFSSA
jgi:hypothetical protein